MKGMLNNTVYLAHEYQVMICPVTIHHVLGMVQYLQSQAHLPCKRFNTRASTL